MNKTVRAVFRADGGVSVIIPAPKSRLENESEEEWLERVFTRAIEEDPDLVGREFVDIDKDNLPPRHTRMGWEKHPDKKEIRVNQAKLDKYNSEELAKEKIEKRQRDMAIDSLIAEGQLPPDYKTKGYKE